MPANCFTRARAAAKSGYALSELINLPGFFFVHKPDGTKYLVDANAKVCDCQARTVCKHIGLVQISLRYVAAMSRKRAVRRRRFSARRIAAFRALAPVMAGSPAPAATTYVPTPEAIALRERCAARIARDFPN